MGFHQEHAEKEEVKQEGFVPLHDEIYNMIFVQRLKELNKASQNLEKIGYYKSWTTFITGEINNGSFRKGY